MKKIKKPNKLEWKIESGVEIPRTRPNYPFDKFKINDSALIIADTKSEIQSIKASAYNYAKHNKCKFVTRSYDREGGDAIRIWRTK